MEARLHVISIGKIRMAHLSATIAFLLQAVQCLDGEPTLRSLGLSREHLQELVHAFASRHDLP